MFFLILFLILLILLLSVLLGLASFYLWKFVRIILILETDFSKATEVLHDSEKTMEELIALPLFYESPEVQQAANEALKSVKSSKVAIGGLVHKFTQRSKQKYVELVEAPSENE